MIEFNKFSQVGGSVISVIVTIPFLFTAIINSIKLIWLPLPSDKIISLFIYLTLILNMILAIGVAMALVIYLTTIISKRISSENNKIKLLLDFLLILVSVSSMIVTRFVERNFELVSSINFDAIFNLWSITLIISVVALICEFWMYKKK